MMLRHIVEEMGADFGLDFAPDSKMATTYIILKLNMCRTRIFLLWKISDGQIFLTACKRGVP